MFAMCVVYGCFSKSQQALVSPRSLIPVVRQLDSCQSEAVVGSSSDVASPSRSRRMSGDAEGRCSPTSSPEADSRVSVRRPAPRGLVDALSRYFTPSDRRRSRVSLNTLPHASPRALVSDSHSPTSAADTTHADDPLPPTLLPQNRSHHKRLISSSESNRRNFWKRGNAAVQSTDRTGVIQRVGCDSPTSEMSPSTCVPSESKPEEVSNLTEIKSSNEEVANSERRSDAIVAERIVKEEVKKLVVTKPRKRRQTQLSSLHDSLSHFFLAEGERKRTPAQYVDSEFLFETYHHFDSQPNPLKRQQTAAQSTSLHAASKVEGMELSVAASWPVTCNRLSNYHLSGNSFPGPAEGK